MVSEEAASNINCGFVITIMLFQITYMVVGTTLAKHNITIIHESIFLIAQCATTANIVRLFVDEKGDAFISSFQFDEYLDGETLLQVLLPVIIQKEGFSLKQKSFFKNISYIIGFGFFGTILNIFGLTLALWTVSRVFQLEGLFSLELQFTEMLTMAIVLSNADTLAPLAQIDSDKYPDIFSVVFGEGVLNDAVVLIAFGTLQNKAGSNSDATTYLIDSWYQILGDFFLCALYSLIVGILCGSLSTLVNKYYRDLQGHVFLEVAIILFTGVITFYICELTFLKLSGIVCIFIFGIFQANYNLYNLSPEAQKKIEDILELFAYVAEAIIFLFLGFKLGHYHYGKFSFYWAPITIGLMIVVRFIVVLFMWPFVSLITPEKNKVGFKDIFIISMSGMIRGAISFSLVLILQSNSPVQISDQIVATIQLIVVVTIGVFTPQNAVLQKCVFKNKKSILQENEGVSDNEQSLIKKSASKKTSYNIIRQNKSDDDYELLTLQLENRKGCRKYFFIINEMVIKPMLIHNYKFRSKNEKQSLANNIRSRLTWKDNFTDVNRRTRMLQGDRMKQYKNKYTYEGIRIDENNKRRFNLSNEVFEDSIPQNYQNKFSDSLIIDEESISVRNPKKVNFKNDKKYSSDFVLIGNNPDQSNSGNNSENKVINEDSDENKMTGKFLLEDSNFDDILNFKSNTVIKK